MLLPREFADPYELFLTIGVDTDRELLAYYADIVGEMVHVMETLGHTQIGLTMNTYAHVLPALQREAAARKDTTLRQH